jgi:hypothetical protein
MLTPVKKLSLSVSQLVDNQRRVVEMNCLANFSCICLFLITMELYPGLENGATKTFTISLKYCHLSQLILLGQARGCSAVLTSFSIPAPRLHAQRYSSSSSSYENSSRSSPAHAQILPRAEKPRLPARQDRTPGGGHKQRRGGGHALLCLRLGQEVQQEAQEVGGRCLPKGNEDDN